jgi:hypothetical protein
MIQHVHNTHAGTAEDEAGDTLAMAPDEADAIEVRAEESRTRPSDTGQALF